MGRKKKINQTSSNDSMSENIKQNSNPLSVIKHDGVDYVKISKLKETYKLVTPQGKKNISFWLCIKSTEQFPAPIYIIPET
jgi:hypothetical protein